MVVKLDSLGDPFYEGSVQQLFAVPGDERLMVAKTTDRGSVFDVGALFEISGHDVNRAVFRQVLYTRIGEAAHWAELQSKIEADPSLDDSIKDWIAPELARCLDRGARTHHVGMPDAVTGAVATSGVPENPSAANVVRRFQILKPERVSFGEASLFDYSRFPHEDHFVVPLEVIVRFGITSASSVYRKYLKLDESAKRNYELELGVSDRLEAWKTLPRPILDFTSKFEPEDRMVSKQEALTMSGLTGENFIRLGQLAILGALAVRDLVGDIGLELWDLKWEFARAGDDLLFVDTIDTDSIRATRVVDFNGRRYINHYNKQAMRDYFAVFHPQWISAINDTKREAASAGVAFTEILGKKQAEGQAPPNPAVDPAFLEIQEKKLGAIRDHLTGKCSAGESIHSLDLAAISEICYYEERGLLDAFGKINGLAG
ncbi:MAG: phosphoribosylaminoimidazolesuccinocarboxamide synthase [Verrucomicrobiota bacterium]